MQLQSNTKIKTAYLTIEPIGQSTVRIEVSNGGVPSSVPHPKYPQVCLPTIKPNIDHHKAKYQKLPIVHKPSKHKIFKMTNESLTSECLSSCS